MFVNTIAKVASLLVWVWGSALPQPVAALFSFAIVAALFLGLFKLLWGLV